MNSPVNHNPADPDQGGPTLDGLNFGTRLDQYPVMTDPQWRLAALTQTIDSTLQGIEIPGGEITAAVISDDLTTLRLTVSFVDGQTIDLEIPVGDQEVDYGMSQAHWAHRVGGVTEEDRYLRPNQELIDKIQKQLPPGLTVEIKPNPITALLGSNPLEWPLTPAEQPQPAFAAPPPPSSTSTVVGPSAIDPTPARFSRLRQLRSENLDK